MESQATKFAASTLKNENLAAARSVRGGINADGCGVGKTVQMLANLMDGRRKKKPRTNLVVVPNSLRSNWQREVEKQCNAEYTSQCVLWKEIAAADKKTIEKAIDQYWIVIVTFEEIRKAGCPLTSFKWHRLIVDEAHNMKNAKSRLFEALFSIEAEFRWILSGTLLVNRATEIHTYLKFLRVPGTGSLRKFKKEYGMGRKEGEGESKKQDSSKLDELLRCLALQRTENSESFGIRAVNVPSSTRRKIPVSDFFH
jgi:SNF2 family DNA or RNA helicase